ncbi:hypothetical protein LEAN103870_08855 [Legionella anisa]|uniref:Transmembrane protein n=1 Tax=Legionella anisa TaxID=28082 RepID=A0AAX0WV65_9GAMM|nr:hypothetical protein [Legionella anisa]AWN73784.1 hypothetical protein DLD14_07990 [Legionella anisa]KTC70401.1 transmembrane protein [Legionella anisa]MBN5937420.1 hypothetical protein [Legionella anisa]MCW8426685.1 hypothetical protein [Legionella anisa]MCW8448348.1 hypothetical protein [Legionella anisa]
MEFGKKQHHHDKVTGTHQHDHGHQPLYPQVEVTSHHPHVEVRNPLYPQVTLPPYNPRVEVRTTPRVRTGYNHHYHDHSYSSTGRGGRVLFVGFFILLPIVVIAAILSSTLGAMSLTTASLTTAGAGAATAGAIAFSASTFGIGALILYGALGLAYLYSSAKECYSSDKNVLDMIKSRVVVTEDELSFKGVMKSIGSVLWSPFLLIGGLSGMAVKAAVNACVSTRSVSSTDKSIQMTESYTWMSGNSLGAQHKSGSSRTPKDVPPVHSELYRTPERTENESHLLDSQIQFPLSSPLYSSN